MPEKVRTTTQCAASTHVAGWLVLLFVPYSVINESAAATAIPPQATAHAEAPSTGFFTTVSTSAAKRRISALPTGTISCSVSEMNAILAAGWSLPPVGSLLWGPVIITCALAPQGRPFRHQ